MDKNKLAKIIEIRIITNMLIIYTRDRGVARYGGIYNSRRER